MKKSAFVLPPKLEHKVEKIQKEMGLDDAGAVIAKAIELLDVSVGRKVILKEMGEDYSLEINDFCDYSKTLEVKKDGSTTEQ